MREPFVRLRYASSGSRAGICARKPRHLWPAFCTMAALTLFRARLPSGLAGGMRLMKRVLTATGLAAMFAVGLAAQSTTGTAGSAGQYPQTAGGTQRGGPRTITGCLRAGDTAGSYMLTNVEGLGGGRRGGDTTSG